MILESVLIYIVASILYNKTNFAPSALFDEYSNKHVHVKDPYFPIELGFDNQMMRRLPHRYGNDVNIGKMDTKTGLPMVNPLPGANRISESNRRTGLPSDHQERLRKLHDMKYNEEEYWRFDPVIGTQIPVKQRYRDSSIQYRFM